MPPDSTTYQVAIVGGGPVGLFLGCALHHQGISCTVLEKRAHPITHSRSIGIHPVSLRLFSEIGLAERFLSKGTKVEKGLAFCNDEQVGLLTFDSCPPPFPFILILPQYKTERLLADHLASADENILRRNAAVTALWENTHGATIAVNQNGERREITAQFIVGCDGKASFIRRAAGIPFTGKPYADTYLMGDFSETTSWGDAAAIFLCSDGLIESFPLGSHRRRWVVKTDHYLSKANVVDITKRIKSRIGHDLKAAENFMLSSFGVEKRFAETLAKNRIILAGDAAHVISPIGGQGMNLGWLDGWDLAQNLKAIFDQQASASLSLTKYSSRRLKVARKAARRAEFNMALGRKTNALFIRKLLLKGMLNTPLSKLMSRLFTMHGLRSYII